MTSRRKFIAASALATASAQAVPFGFRLPGGAFDPRQISGLQLWLDASQIVGLNDGDAVATWADASGNGRDATQVTASSRPTYETAAINSKAAVRFDGVDDILTGSLPAVGTGNYTMFIVCKADSVVGYHTPLSLGGTSAASGLLISTNGGANNGTWLIGRVLFNFLSTTSPDIAASWHLLCVQRTGASNADAFVNGTATTPASGNPGAQDITSGYTVGNYAGGGQPWNGPVAEIIFYNADIGTVARQQIENYIRAKWGTP